MKQCPFCGTEWKGRGPCPNCGMKPGSTADESLFRPPENGVEETVESPPEFDTEELLRWEPSPEADAPTEPEDTGDGETQEDSEEEGSGPLKSPWKRGKKLAVAAVAVVVAAAVLAVSLWPRPQALPQKSAFFVQDGALMALPAGGEPQKIAPSVEALESDMWVSPDQKSVVWLNRQDLQVYLQPPKGETVQLPNQDFTAYPVFSQDSRFLYYSTMKDSEEETLYRYDIVSGKEQKVGKGCSDYMQEEGSLLAVGGEESFAIYSIPALTEKWSIQTPAQVVSIFEDTVYYAQPIEGYNTYRLCSWKDGEVKVLLVEGLASAVPTADGSVYLLCRTGEDEVPVSGLVKNDLGEEGEAIMQKLEGETVRLPETFLYCLKGGELLPMGKNLGVYYFGKKAEATLVVDKEYYKTEEIEFLLSDIMQFYGNKGDSVVSHILTYIDAMWPVNASVGYLAKGGKLFSLPEDIPQGCRSLQTVGDWVCFYRYSDNAASRGLWLGRIEGEKVVFQDFYPVPDSEQFLLTEQGKVYYWTGRGNQFMGALYENGVPLLMDVSLQNVQTTEDGAVYFLNGSSTSWTLNRIVDGKLEAIAQNVQDFTAFTRDYAVYLQNREDQEDYDLMVCMSGKEKQIVAEGVESLIRPGRDQMQVIPDYSGGVDNSHVTTDAVG